MATLFLSVLLPRKDETLKIPVSRLFLWELAHRYVASLFIDSGYVPSSQVEQHENEPVRVELNRTEMRMKWHFDF